MIQLIEGLLYSLPLGNLMSASGLIYHLANGTQISRPFFELHIFISICPFDISSKISYIQHISDQTSPNLVFSKCSLSPQIGSHSFSCTNKTSLKSLQITNAGEDVEEREPPYTDGRNVNRCSHYGEQYGGSSKN